MTADRVTSGAGPLPVTLADVEAARELLDGVVRHTPVEPSRALAGKVGGPVLLKCENLQRAGSFKIRGAYTRIARLSERERAHGVVAASAGNHAQGVALAAQMLGIKARVYMPFSAPLPKVQATRGYGAEVEFVGTTIDESLIVAREWADSTGAVLVHPFDHADIVAGQGTVGLEILDQVPDVATIVVSTGGGGLLAGIAAAVRARRPEVSIFGVQAEGAAAYPASLSLGRPQPLETMSTMADGIAVGCPGDVPFAVVQALVDGVVTVDEELISRALLFLLERAKLVVEPAGAVAVAALMDPDVAAAIRPPAVAVLSGGNIDPAAHDADHPPRHGRRGTVPARAAAGSGPARVARGGARAARPGGGERARGRARSHRCPAVGGRGRDRAPARDARAGPHHRGARRPARRGLPAAGLRLPAGQRPVRPGTVDHQHVSRVCRTPPVASGAPAMSSPRHRRQHSVPPSRRPREAPGAAAARPLLLLLLDLLPLSKS